MRTQNNTRHHNSNSKSFKIRQNLTNSSLKSTSRLEHTLLQQCLQLQNPKTPDLHQSNKKNLASHQHCMMTKKLKLAIVKWTYDTKNAMWTGFTARNHDKTKWKDHISWKKIRSSWQQHRSLGITAGLCKPCDRCVMG